MIRRKHFAPILFRALALAGAFLILPVNATSAQFDSATVLGTIKDSNGAVVAGVTVTLKNIETAITVSAQTDESGDFQGIRRPGSPSHRGPANAGDWPG